MSLRLEEHKGSRIWLRWLKYLRSRYPREQRVYIIQDGLSAHWTEDVWAWAKGNRVTFVPSATNASWMNPVECHAGQLQTAAMAGSDDQRWWEVEEAFKRAAAQVTRENRVSGKQFLSTLRRVSKHRRPLWTRR